MLKSILLKIISLSIALTAFIYLSACTDNTDTTATTPSESNCSVVNEDGLSYKKIDNINELELDKITKLSIFVQEEEIFTNNQNTISDFCDVIKNLVPNDNLEPSINEDGTHHYGFIQIMAYIGDDLIYTFSLNGGEDNKSVYLNYDKSYFYCDIDSENSDKFSEIYNEIYKLSESNQ